MFLISFIWNSHKCAISKNMWCLIKPPTKNSIQTIFQGRSPWATLIHNSMFVLGVHHCVQLLPGVYFFQTFPLPFPLLKVLFSFTSLVPFTWNSQNCPIANKQIDALLKPNKKNIIQTIFQGGSPWATLIHNSMFVLGVHYCVELLPEAIFFKHSLYLFLC